MKFSMNVFLDNRSNRVEFQGQRSRSHDFFGVFCVHNAAATRGQYLALSKAWWACFKLCLNVALSFCCFWQFVRRFVLFHAAWFCRFYIIMSSGAANGGGTRGPGPHPSNCRYFAINVHVYCSIKSATTSALTCPASRPQQRRRPVKKVGGAIFAIWSFNLKLQFFRQTASNFWQGSLWARKILILPLDFTKMGFSAPNLAFLD